MLCHQALKHPNSPCFFAIHGTSSANWIGKCAILARFCLHAFPSFDPVIALLRLQSSSGSQLVPPLGGPARLAELGPLLPHNILLEGNTWKESSVDIAIAGPHSTAAYFGSLAFLYCPKSESFLLSGLEHLSCLRLFATPHVHLLNILLSS